VDTDVPNLRRDRMAGGNDCFVFPVARDAL
jgi:hypothetical protein